MAIRIRGKLQQADLDDIQRLFLGRYYWARYSIHPFVIGIAVGSMTGFAWAWLRRDWLILDVTCFAAMLLTALHAWGARRDRGKDLDRVNRASQSGSLWIQRAGVFTSNTERCRSFLGPTTRPTKKARVFWLKPSGKGGVTMLPISHLTERERQT